MSRIVFLGLNDSDVDALSRIPETDDVPRVLVAHPDPTALVLQLASLAELPTATSPPAPRPDDVVVAPEETDTECAAWLDAFRKAGARVLVPRAFPENEPAEETGPPKEAEPGEETEPEGEPGDETEPGGEPAPSPTVMERIMSHSKDQEPSARPKLSVVRPGEAFDAVWADPETTLRYLLERAVGAETPVTLWWDGGIGIWVPWVWTGASPGSEGKAVVKLGSPFGGFRLTGDWTEGTNLPVAALTRVAEDMALRDLAVWEKTAESLSGMTVPRGRDAIRGWAAPVLRALDPETAWLWERQPDGWKLRHVHGEAVSFSGDLLVSEHLLGALFEGPGLRWERWRPAEHLSAVLGFSPADGQWPLRWERVKKALSARG